MATKVTFTMKTFKEFLEIAYPAAKAHTVYNPLTGEKKKMKAGKAMAKRSSSSAGGDD